MYDEGLWEVHEESEDPGADEHAAYSRQIETDLARTNPSDREVPV